MPDDFNQVAATAPKNVEITGMRIAPERLLYLQRQAIHAAYSGDPDRLIQPKVIMQAGDRDHLPPGKGWQVAGAKEKCGRRL